MRLVFTLIGIGLLLAHVGADWLVHTFTDDPNPLIWLGTF